MFASSQSFISTGRGSSTKGVKLQKEWISVLFCCSGIGKNRSMVKASFECFRFFRSENLKFRKWACFQKFRKACLSRALFRFSDVCGLRAVSDLWRQFSDWTQTWSSEKLNIWRNFFRFAIRNISIFLLKNIQGHDIAKFLGCLPVCICAKNDLL